MWPFTTITYCNSGKQIGVWFCQFEHVTFEFFSPPWRGASAMVRRHRCRARWESQPGATKSSQSLTNKSDEPTKDKDGHARTGCSKISKYNIVYIYTYIYYESSNWFVVQLTVLQSFHEILFRTDSCLPVPDSEEWLGRFWGKMLPVPGAQTTKLPWSMV